ncbi:activated Cdc42 kinase-like isoform X1 [Condylostylus longicornis]|uniref:activated Cdc42 kinase-like isoform X1 n=1 Tax=Condylostylus longicornis TaxID=2530218 RepID=UPI00244DE0BF|nr:activated Cdc42 kinase-like isoform X1 [Condylostylus longicornis]
MAEIRHIDLYEFLVESELQHYYSSIKDELKITNASHLKYATDEDLRQVGFSKPEIRRLRKFYEKYYPHGYLSKIKRLLQPPIRRDDNQMNSSVSSTEATKVITLPSKTPTQKHIIPADLISVNKQLGAGEFGVVQQGVWTNGTERIQVAIKCLCRERMQSNPIEFLKEAAIMHAIEHENIVRLYGVVLDTNSLMLVTELAHLRSLLECLKDPGLRVNFLTVPTLCEFAMQICNGMMYLENKRLIHRDLAARNILVFSKNKVKISDFGLSRALGVGKDYYKTNFNVNLKLPIAWCAPECITFLRFTNASDVWAYGVCLWEMFSYGFQPWAALTGLQILEAIDDPNFQRLEQPECCPKDYYNLMLRCWQHESTKRPKFSEIYSLLPDMKPEQLKTVINNCEPKKDHLLYLQGEIITVLDKNSNSPFWKGVLNSGKTGLFNPSNTVAYLEGLPSSTNRDGFFRTSERLSKKKLRSEMISMPQNDLKHTLHIGLDGAYFGDVSLLGSSQQTNPLPKQIVTPYKPSEDIEQTPLLLPPTPTSPDSIQTASTYFPEENQTISQTNPSFINSNQNTPQNHNFHHTFDFPPKQTQAFSSSNPFASEAFNSQNSSSNKKIEINENVVFTNLENDSLVQNFKSNNNINWPLSASEGGGIETQHEYHEISDDEMIVDKFDYGPSLLDEINSMFGCINMANDEISLAKLQGNLNSPKTGEVVDLHLKTNRKLNGSDNNGNKAKKKTCGTVKPISVKDEKILNQAIEIANEISAKSMTDLVSDTSQTMRSPKRKFSFRLPHLTHNTIGKDLTLPSYSINGSNGTYNSQLKERKKFSEELQSISDLQRFRSLSEIQTSGLNIRIPIFDKESSDFCFKKSREILSRPIDIEKFNTGKILDKKTRDLIDENLLDIENTLNALNLDFIQTYSELEKTDSVETLLADQLVNLTSIDSNDCNGKLSSSSSNRSKLQNIYNLNSEIAKLNESQSELSSSVLVDKQFTNNSTQLYNNLVEKLEDKRSTTPDTGFASRETNLSLSRRSSQKSNYSPQDSFSSKEAPTFSNPFDSRFYSSIRNEQKNNQKILKKMENQISPLKNVNKSNNSLYNQLQQNSPVGEYSGSRQRSMSFTDNYQIKSPALSEPQMRVSAGITNDKTKKPNDKLCSPRSVTSFRYKNIQNNVNPSTLVCKSRSVKSRTLRRLRRLSYNPIVVETSSSSESDFDRSIAQSECDIRSKVSVTLRKRRQLFNRKAFSSGTDELPHEKIYGSNASIKSAPHYNYNKDLEMEKYNYLAQNLETAVNYNERIYDFGNQYRDPKGNFHGFNNVIKPPRAFSTINHNTNYAREQLYSEFDVSKLTGKSPTSIGTNTTGTGSGYSVDNNRLRNNVLQKQQISSSTKAAEIVSTINSNIGDKILPPSSNPLFQWPEKIHASTVKQNELMWRQLQAVSAQSALFGNIKVKQAFSSKSSSSDSDDSNYRNKFIPSPAP